MITCSKLTTESESEASKRSEVFGVRVGIFNIRIKVVFQLAKVAASVK